MRSTAALLVLAFASLACGIGDSVGDECMQQRRAYEALQKKSSGLATRGVGTDTPIVRDTTESLARAREALRSCARQPG